MKAFRRALIAVVAALVAVSLAAVLWTRPVEVNAAAVTRGPFERTVEEDGKTRVRERYMIAAPLAGRLLRIGLEEGDRLARGDLVARILPTAPPFLDERARKEGEQRVAAAEAGLQGAEAAVERARVALRQDEIDLDRARRLAADGVLSRSELDRAELAASTRTKEVKAVEFEREVAAHELEMARATLSQATASASGGVPHGVEPWEVRSPVPGRVLRVLQKSETVVAAGTALVELADPEDLEVAVDLLTSDAAQVQPGARVAIEGWGGPRALAGRVRLVEPSGYTKVSPLGVEEQRVDVLIDITSPPEEWRSLGDGFRVDARITLEASDDALRVPTSALFRDGDRWAAYAIEQGRARARIVRLGARGDREAVVEEGLAEGDRVITYPSDAVADGVRVRARE